MPLTTGSIAFLGWNADGTDGLAFVAVDEIPAGTVIRFQDNEYNGTAFNTGEGSTTWTSPASAIPAGTVIEFTATSDAASRSASLGSLSGGTLSLSATAETVYAFVGTSETAPTTFLAAITNAGSFTTGDGPLTGTGLTAGVNAVALPAGTDVAAYLPSVGGTAFATRDAALTVLNDAANWIRQDGAGDQDADGTTPDAPFRTDPESPIAGVSFTIGAPAAPGLLSISADATPKAEGATFTLTVTLTAAAGADTVVTLTATGDTADFNALPASVTIPAGQASATVTLESIQDAAFEPTEALTVTATLNDVQRQLTVQITNDDPPATTNLGGIEILQQAASLTGSVSTPVATESLGLRQVANYVTGDGAGGAESISFDPTTDRAYFTNAAKDRVDILDLSNPAAPSLVGSIDVAAAAGTNLYGEVNSVAVKNGIVAVAIQNKDGGSNGIVALFDGNGDLIKVLEVGVQPDQLTFSPDGSLLLVANEAERYYDTSGTPTVENAPGTISIIAIPADPSLASVRNTVGFTALDPFGAELAALGIKTLGATTAGGVNVPASSVSGDLEPEYIAVSPDGTKAYVTIQEANAVAVIDLTDTAATAPMKLLPLGAVDFSLTGNEADFSDRDGPGGAPSISVGNSPVKGLLQPDAIATFSVGGQTYFVTANEGDSRIISGPSIGEVALNEARASAVQSGAPADYARLNLDTVWSSTDDLYAFGGRGFSVFRQNADGSIEKVDETGGDLEQIIAALPNAGTVFNGENGGAFDTRSDNKGAEPEGVTVGTVDGKPYAFLSLERIGGVMVWDLSTPDDVQFVRYIPPTAGEYGPEVITFVSAENSPVGRALVITANEISGSVTVYEASNVTRISEVQGAGTASTLVGRTVTVEAIVVGDFQNGDADTARNLGGFFLQEEAFDQDGNALSSEGVFISAASLPTDVALGDRVRVTGTVAENFGKTQIVATSVTVVQAGAVADVNDLAVDVDLPTADVQGTNGTYRADLEAYEGMLVRFPEVLTITEQFNLDQFGEVRLTQGEYPSSYTQTNDPSVAGYDAHLRDIASRSILLDDGRSVSNPNLDNTVVDGDYNTATAPRMGDTVTNLTGILDYDFSQYRVQAIQNGPGINDFIDANPRPATPPDVGGTLKVASFNVLNYFRTLDDGGSTANGSEPRGAETAAEFTRQTDKLVDTILTLDADILGLIELENDFQPGSPGNAIEYLVGQLNLEVGFEKYDWVRPGQQFVGGDAIAVGVIYDKTEVRITPGTTVAILDDTDAEAAALVAQSTVGGVFNGLNTSRAALAVTFEEIATGEDVTISVNHFKSKSGSGTGADADARDGAGSWNNQRELAATALRDWLATNPTGAADPDKIILGDLNAYAKEDPIDILTAAGFTDQGADSYSYVFDGQRGSLDHIMTSGSLSDNVTGVADWHINADEADALDYQLNFNADLTTNERDPSYFDADTPARVSDHDPVVLGLNLRGETAYTLQLLHLSDGEAGLLAGTTAKYLAALTDAFDGAYANTLILSGGDNFLPGPFLAAGTDPSVIPTLNAVSGSTIAPGATVPIGAVDTAIHNAIGVEVSGIGNHEFDLGSNVFAASFTPGGGWVGANYALVSANLDLSGDAALNPRFTNTVGDGTTPTPLASTLKGRIVPATVVEEGGEKIGIVGATTQLLESISSPTGTEVKGFPTGPGANGEADDMALLASQLQPVIDEMRAEGINKIVLISHLQVIVNEQLLATLLKGVDIILSAGSNTRLGDADDVPVAFPGHAANFAGPYPIVATDADGGTTLIVNTDNEYTYLGRLVVDFDADGNIILPSLEANTVVNGAYASTAENVAEAWGTTVDNLETTAFAEGTKGDQVRDLTDAVGAVISVKDGNVAGFTDVYLEGERSEVRSEETNLGSLTADANAFALRQALDLRLPEVVVSFKNGGGIRAQIGTVSAPDPVDGTVDKLPPPANPSAGKPEGGVSQLDIENSLRFDNKLMAFDTTAQGMKAILEHGVAAGTLQGRFPQIGGVAFSWDPSAPAGSRVTDIALLDGRGNLAYTLYDDGVLLAGAPGKITVVTLNFLANGGDGYPAKANGDNFRYLLSDGSLSAPVDEALNFTDPAVIAANTPAGSALLGEQQALFEYLDRFHGTPEAAYDEADTPVELDTRIQNLSARADTVLEREATGTDGNDRLVGRVSYDDIRALGGDDTVAGAAGKDTLDGASGADKLFGQDGNDVLLGGLGADILDGGSGIDVMEGGQDNDVYVVDNADDVVIELAGGGNDTVRASVSVTLAAEVENLVLLGDAGLRGTGNGVANRIVGNAGDNVLVGGGGNDVLIGGLGADVLRGGIGADRIYVALNTNPDAPDAANTIAYGSAVEGRDVIYGFASGRDVIEISVAGFGGGLAAGALDPTRFAANESGRAAATFGQFVFETDRDILWWDADGTGAGARELIAQFQGGSISGASDFILA
ncbi:ExeM/NucH family extracellular endonuclease [Roseomonas sp. CCTCC AB2023176]|uniref:ExeM/NucH family extracellular endonuclease n=1 Tax=Roseomonas sp. CCTCC AB2023176 TaxID=3342640 RepID=UPI0035DD3045